MVTANDAYCFACGKDNPIGLKLEFTDENGKCVARKILAKEYEGYDGIAHGGILGTMLDEVMVQYLHRRGENAVTAKLETRYRQQTPIGEMLTIIGWEESRKGSFVKMKGQVILSDGTVTVEATAQMSITEKI